MDLPHFRQKDTLIKAGTVTLLFVISLIAIFYEVKWFELAENILQMGTFINGSPPRLEPKVTFAFLLLALPIGFVVLIVLIIISEKRTKAAEGARMQAETARNEAERIKDDRTTKAFKTLQGMMRASSRIRDQLTPPALAPVKSFDKVRFTYLIEKDFSARVYREYDIRAPHQPLHFWSNRQQATAYAQPVDYLDDIEFKINEKNGTELVYLLAENSPLLKEVVIYFLPRIEPGEPARQVVISYRWPGLLRQLDQTGEEDFNFEIGSKDPVPLFEARFFLEPGTGKSLACELSGPRHGNQKLTRCRHEQNAWEGYVYTVENGPAGSVKYCVTLRLTRA